MLVLFFTKVFGYLYNLFPYRKIIRLYTHSNLIRTVKILFLKSPVKRTFNKTMGRIARGQRAYATL